MQEIVISGSGIHASDYDVSSSLAPNAEAGCAMAVETALEQAKRQPHEIDALLVACPNPDSPLIGEALRSSLGAAGWSWDLDIASATATSGIRVASELVARERAGLVVVVRPEPLSPHPAAEIPECASERSGARRGESCSAIVLESGCAPVGDLAYEVLGTRLQRMAPSLQPGSDASIAQHLRAHLWELDLAPDDLRRLWIHQESPETSLDIARGVLGRDADPSEAPVFVDEADPRGAAGSLRSFHLHKRDLWEGEIGILCSLGAQGSVGSTVLRRWRH